MRNSFRYCNNCSSTESLLLVLEVVTTTAVTQTSKSVMLRCNRDGGGVAVVVVGVVRVGAADTGAIVEVTVVGTTADGTTTGTGAGTGTLGRFGAGGDIDDGALDGITLMVGGKVASLGSLFIMVMVGEMVGAFDGITLMVGAMVLVVLSGASRRRYGYGGY